MEIEEEHFLNKVTHPDFLQIWQDHPFFSEFSFRKDEFLFTVSSSWSEELTRINVDSKAKSFVDLSLNFFTR